MGDQRQEFTNNFNNYESTRFDFGIAMLMTLFSKQNQDIINKKIREQLIDVQSVDDGVSRIKGMVYANETDDIDKSRIFYVKHNGDKVAYSWHTMVHELTHFIGKPDRETIESEITGNSDRSELGGVQIFDFNTNSEYGNFFNECGADLICEMAMTSSVECRETNPQIKSADDIIYTNNRYQKTDYDSLSTIARLMTVAMDNNFSNQSYDKMIHSDSGLLDRQVEMVNQETGELIDVVPTNDYLYAMTGHGKHLEEQFDKYSEDGSYRDMCAFLDGEIKALQSGENHTVDKGILKEQLLRMADMVNNKMYVLQSNKCITQEQKDAFVGRFNLVFNQALQEYDIGALTPEDIKKTTKSMSQTKSREGIKSQAQNIAEERKNIINLEEYRRNREQPQATPQVEMPEGYSINEFEEIIRQARDEQQPQVQSQPQVQGQEQESRTSRFGATINPSSYAERLQPISQQNENKLSLKQRIAQFLQKNNLFMNMSFVEKFVHQQLDVLPEPTQDIRESATENNTTKTTNSTREDFINQLTNFGAYRNLPPIQRMSDPQKLEEMRRKMEQHTQENDDPER